MRPREIAKKNGDVIYITSCKKCGKETEQYSLSGQCKVCLRSYKLSPEGRNGIKYTNLKSRYGITKDEWHWMLKEQYGKHFPTMSFNILRFPSFQSIVTLPTQTAKWSRCLNFKIVLLKVLKRLMFLNQVSHIKCP